MKKNQGWTIIQTMVAVLIAGLALAFVTEYLIDERCAEQPSREMCARD